MHVINMSRAVRIFIKDRLWLCEARDDKSSVPGDGMGSAFTLMMPSFVSFPISTNQDL